MKRTDLIRHLEELGIFTIGWNWEVKHKGYKVPKPVCAFMPLCLE